MCSLLDKSISVSMFSTNQFCRTQFAVDTGYATHRHTHLRCNGMCHVDLNRNQRSLLSLNLNSITHAVAFICINWRCNRPKPSDTYWFIHNRRDFLLFSTTTLQIDSIKNYSEINIEFNDNAQRLDWIIELRVKRNCNVMLDNFYILNASARTKTKEMERHWDDRGATNMRHGQCTLYF